MMVSANQVPLGFTGFDASDVRRGVPAPGLTGSPSHLFVLAISSQLFSVSFDDQAAAAIGVRYVPPPLVMMHYRGQLIRGTLSIEAEPRSHGLTAAYTEMLPTGPFRTKGSVVLTKGGLYAHLRETGGDAQFFFSLFPPSPPGSVLGGYMCGATIIGPEPLPSATRILMVR